MIKSRDRRTAYAGLQITVRWSEQRLGDSWGPGSRRYIGSFLIAAKDAELDAWHHLPGGFATIDEAAARALAEAKRKIDAISCV